MNKLGWLLSWGPGRRHNVARAAAVLVALVILALFFAASQAATSTSGTVGLTVNMPAFSSDLVKVGSSVTTNLTATVGSNYNPPVPAPDEGSLTDSYAWSPITVKFSGTASGTYTTISSGPTTYTYTPDSIPSEASVPFTFMPHEAGYWQVSVCCTVTVTDTKTQFKWYGNGSAGPEGLTSYVLSFTSGTPQVDGSNLNVSVGEKIPLTAQFGPSDMTLKWTVPGSIIAGYTTVNSGPATVDYTKPSTAEILPVTAADLAASSLTYYWMDTDSGTTEEETVTLAGTLPNGKSPPSASNTFGVYRPTPIYTTTYPGAITLADGVLDDGPNDGGYDMGIQFNYSITNLGFGDTSNLSTVQLCDLLTVTTEQYNVEIKTTTTFEFTLPSAMLPGPLLDTVFPYPEDKVGSASDSPNYGVNPPAHGYGFGAGTWQTYNVVVSETFTHDLLFTPTLPTGGTAIDAPLSQVSWGWNADAENPNNGGFYLASSAKSPPNPPYGIDLSALPTWNNNAADTTWGWGNPQWFITSSP